MPTRMCITLRLWEYVLSWAAIFRLTTGVVCCMYSPTMATIIAKQKRRKLYYYVVESARVDGKPRIVKQTYLGTAERVAALIQDRTAPLPLSVTWVDFGLPGALWLAAQQSGVWEVLTSQWPEPRSGPSPAHHRLLAYDTTNFHTWVASTNTRNTLAQRGHNKQGRHNLRQVGLSYVLDGENGLSLCHHVYAGNIADAEEFPVALKRVVALLDQHGLVRDTVTLVIDKGSAALANTLELEQARIGWISALPWNQAPQEFRERAVEQLPALSSAQPGVQAAAERMIVHGREYLCVLKYSASFAAEQLHSVTTALAKALPAMRRLSMERVFRGLKEGDWLGWGPIYHWTDQKIRVHAFYCMLGISLLQYIYRKAQVAWAGLSMEQLLEELGQIVQFAVLYTPREEKAPNRVALVLSKET